MATKKRIPAPSPKKPTSVDTEKLLARIDRLEGSVFSGRVGVDQLATDCVCQNCGCDSRAGTSCGCDPRCVCQGHTADRLDSAINVMLGGTRKMSMQDIKTLKELADKVSPRRK